MHAEALERDELDGERLMMASTPITMPQIARYLKSNGYKVRTMALPNIVVKVMAIFIKEARLVTRGLGTTNHYDCSNTIEKTGWKGKRIGNYGVHDKQALVLVNYGGANGNDIYKLAQDIQSSVKDKFGIPLQMEVNVIK